ncbi:hypothetical protein ACQPX6_16900 [Actinomycetospora sp. CA-101289]|uniref:hypothetical protein n=1 Tax=Actinomycetospora sp. CA-101289 TaxID=3239893 RepID=UPI003D99D64B
MATLGRDEAVRARFGVPPGERLRALAGQTGGVPVRLTVLLDGLDRRGRVRVDEVAELVDPAESGAAAGAHLGLLDTVCLELLRVLAAGGGTAAPRTLAAVLDTTPAPVDPCEPREVPRRARSAVRTRLGRGVHPTAPATADTAAPKQWRATGELIVCGALSRSDAYPESDWWREAGIARLDGPERRRWWGQRSAYGWTTAIPDGAALALSWAMGFIDDMPPVLPRHLEDGSRATSTLRQECRTIIGEALARPRSQAA